MVCFVILGLTPKIRIFYIGTTPLSGEVGFFKMRWLLYLHTAYLSLYFQITPSILRELIEDFPLLGGSTPILIGFDYHGSPLSNFGFGGILGLVFNLLGVVSIDIEKGLGNGNNHLDVI
jgi:hypothetical protein